MDAVTSGAVASGLRQRAKAALICYSLVDLETGGKVYICSLEEWTRLPPMALCVT